jgi:hypothetical protein
MTNHKNQLPDGEFRKNADREATVGPHGPPPDAKGQKEKPVADDKANRSDPNPNFSGSEYQGQKDVENRSGGASRPKKNL